MSAIGGMWLLWAVLWAAGALRGKPVARREGVGSRLLHLLPLVASSVLLVGRGPLWRRLGLGWLDGTVLPWHPALGTAGALLVAAGLALALWARWHLGGNWSGTVTLKHRHELVQDGPYRRIRHPIYTGLLLAILGTALAVDAWRGALALLLAALAVWRKVRTEERIMAEAFGAAYAAYRARSGALVPRAP